MSELKDESVHLIATSPPYWQLKDYSCISSPTFSTSWPAPCHVLEHADNATALEAIVRASTRILNAFIDFTFLFGPLCLYFRAGNKY